MEIPKPSEDDKAYFRSLLPEAAAVTLADADRGLARGDLFVDTGHLRQLIGRPATTLRDAVASALR